MKKYDFTILKGASTYDSGEATKQQLDYLLNSKEWKLAREWTTEYNDSSMTTYWFQKEDGPILWSLLIAETEEGN